MIANHRTCFNKNLKPLLLFVILITIFIAQYFLLMLLERSGNSWESRSRRNWRKKKDYAYKLYGNNDDHATTVSFLARQAGNLVKWWREMGDACGPNNLPFEKEEEEEEEEEKESFLGPRTKRKKRRRRGTIKN